MAYWFKVLHPNLDETTSPQLESYQPQHYFGGSQVPNALVHLKKISGNGFTGDAPPKKDPSMMRRGRPVILRNPTNISGGGLKIVIPSKK